jgi:glucokinase
MNILVGDIGGTKTILAMVTDGTGSRTLLHERTFPSLQYNSLEAMIHDYLGGTTLPIDLVCFAVAGPVVNGQAKITNLPWFVESEQLKSAFNLPNVRLINDLESVAYSIPALEPVDIYTLHEGLPITGGTIAVIAPGTGLGEAYLTLEGEAFRAHPSEGSHASFGPTTPLQMELLTYMWEKKGFDHVSYERVCSGALGFPNLYDFLKNTGRYSEPGWLVEKLVDCADPAPIIVEAAKDKTNPCEICVATLDLFCEILAAEAGNLALKILSTGGIYLGGGIPPHILDELQKPKFLFDLRNKGRFQDLISRMPVKVILNAKAGLIGAAVNGLQTGLRKCL